MVSELTGDDVMNGLSLLRMTQARDAGFVTAGVETAIFLPEDSSRFPSLPSLVAMRLDL